jgi:bacterioferritin-associated ferredoxin
MVMPAQQQVGVSLNLQEVYSHLCPKCQQEMRKLIKDKVTDQMVDQVIGPPSVEKKEGVV